jgi:uncharacterized protein (DUF488 family)
MKEVTFIHNENKKPIYSIGYGNRSLENFLLILKRFNIEFLIDVRSSPFSKFKIEYNKNDLKTFLNKNGIKYVFMGDSIGGIPKDETCYTDEGKIDYEKLKTKNYFLQGIERLKVAFEKDLNIILMCSELNPCDCHRSKVIGKVLESENIKILHIDEKEKVQEQLTIINKLNKGLSEYDLFGNPVNSTSKKSLLKKEDGED